MLSLAEGLNANYKLPIETYSKYMLPQLHGLKMHMTAHKHMLLKKQLLMLRTPRRILNVRTAQHA